MNRLSPAQGVVHGLLLTVPLWIVVLLLLWWLL